eukprot:408308-Pleurochrysis_carterae.AAC.2
MHLRHGFFVFWQYYDIHRFNDSRNTKITAICVTLRTLNRSKTAIWTVALAPVRPRCRAARGAKST